MSRLQKKCVIVSVGLHLLLLAVIVIGPAFSPKNTTPEVQYINFVPSIVTAANVVGGGNPNAGRAPVAAVHSVPPAPRPPAPKPETKPEPKPEAKAEPKTAPKPEPDRTELAKDTTPDPNDWTPRKTLPHIITTPQVRHSPSDRARENAAAAEREARRAAQAQRELAQAFASAANGIREGSASATAIDDDFGPGGGGPAYAGYDSLVQMVYQNAWVKPTDTESDSPVAYATVTIARDGSVVPGSARIITRSRDSQMDASVQRVLDRVSTIGRPFPAEMKEKQRTYKIRFDLKKRSLT